jgi:hypothetical protein
MLYTLQSLLAIDALQHTNSDNHNCGGCGKKCHPGQTCEHGHCKPNNSCPPGKIKCSGNCAVSAA